MSTRETGNVLQFPSKQKPQTGNKVHNLTGVSASNVQAITDNPGNRIFWERNVWRYSCAEDFFRVLMEKGVVTIVSESDCMDRDSELVVGEGAERFELSAGHFTQLTARVPAAITDIDAHVSTYLNRLGIKMGFRARETSIARPVLTEDELPDYHPEEIHAFDHTTGAIYNCELYHDEDGPIGYGEAREFDTIGYEVNLLDLILYAIDDAESSGFVVDGASIDVTYCENGDMIITQIPGKLLERVIRDAIARTDYEPTSTDFSRIRNHYFETVVAPKLSEDTPIEE